jgi:glycine hydroxymethyltransferase
MDKQINELIKKEILRQREGLTLIPSENYASEEVLRAMGTPLSNKYSEGYPGKRYYSGNEVIDEIESLAVERAKKLFGAEHANVQPHSGSQANAAVYLALLKPGDKVLGFDLAAGGHLTHGSPVNFSGLTYDFAHYGVDKQTELIDFGEVAKKAAEFKPKLIVVSTTSYSRVLDFQKFGAIAKKVGAYLLGDIAHVAGLVATGDHSNPFPYCDVVTATTHKTLRGPRGGLVLCKKELAEKIDKAVFPGVQGGPLENIIAAKAICFYEAGQPEFKTYQRQVILNARVMAEEFLAEGFRLVSGGTDNHLLVIDLSPINLDARQVQDELGEVGLYANRNAIPFDAKPPFNPSGLRLGSPAITTRGFKEKEARLAAQLAIKIIKNLGDQKTKEEVKKEISSLCAEFLVYENFQW